MLVACVLSLIVCSAIYGLVRLKLQSWLEDGRMDPPSLKKRAVAPNKHSGYSTLNLHPRITMDLTEDEDDDVPGSTYEDNYGRKTSFPTKSACELDDCGMNSNGCNMNARPNQISSPASGSRQSGIFSDTTDSLESDEKADQSPYNTPLKHNFPKPLFTWDRKPRQYESSETIDLTDDSDTPDASRSPRPRVYTNKNKFKGKRAGQEEMSKRKESHFPIFKMEGNIPEMEEKEEKKVPEVLVQCELTMSGVKVKLPVNPYPSQKAVMAKIIQGCTKKQHALLESPTGSGKTLALLCGSLAWQDHYAAELEKERQKNLYADLPQNEFDDVVELEECDAEAKGETKAKLAPVPKIFYGTRTHRQIAQVVRELGKTSYRFKRMTILSSREHTCIRMENRNKTELCNELLDPTKRGYCEFYTENSKKALGTFAALSNHGVNGVWDIEDLNMLGRRHSSCPYFAARSLMQDAEIIFCPYNYLLDPDIRESMQLNLTNQVIILDEAHNIEDICREASSVSIREDHIMQIFYEFKDLCKNDRSCAPVYEIVMSYAKALSVFLNQVEVLEYDAKNEYACSKYWTGAEAIEIFNIHKIGVAVFSSVIEACQFILVDYQRKKETMRESMGNDFIPVMSLPVKINVEHLLFALKMLRSEKHVHDYRVCVTEGTVKDFKPPPVADNTWYSAGKKSNRARTLKFMCMSPAVTFAPLAASARTIVLASGTLSPTSSFQSELGTPFPQMLNANHVIQRDQIYASYITKGPTGTVLRATYKNVNQFTFQDELGLILLDICETVPYGVLIFFSSYYMMNTQINRWRLSGLWKRISVHKAIFIEPRFAGDLSQVMNDYRQTISDTSITEEGEISGALLLAVFRGKVAEGIDFSDNEARCVVTVGIPFAVANDPIVKMKMEYNRKNAVSKGLLNDSEWYTVQAFRALNQALGRCIRHKDDWGAVLMIDERLQLAEYNKNLPKWIKSSLVDSFRYNLKEELRHFVAKQAQRDTENKLET